jgi:hypothetical protein
MAVPRSPSAGPLIRPWDNPKRTVLNCRSPVLGLWAGPGGGVRSPAGGPPLMGGIFNAGAVRQHPQHGHGQHLPMAGQAGRFGTLGLLPLPAHLFEGPEAQLDSHLQPVPAQARALGQHIGRDDPRLLLGGRPHCH